MSKKILLLLSVIFAVFMIWRIIVLILPSNHEAGGAGQAAVAVEVDSVHHRFIEEVRMFTGSVIPWYRYILAPKISGRLHQLEKRIGDAVAPGQVVAVIDDAEYRQLVREAEANLQIANASLIEARSELTLSTKEMERQQSLSTQGLSSQASMDAATNRKAASEARVDVAEAQVRQREAALQSARIRLSYTLLKASRGGLVGERFVDEGELLTINDPIVSIIGIDSVYVRTVIIERDYGKIRIGQEAMVTVDAFPDKSFAGKVLRIAPEIREESRVAEMEVLVSNGNRELKPGMFARVHVVLESKENAQVVPRQAVIQHNGVDGVYIPVNENDNIISRFVPIKIGLQSPQFIEVLDPLDLGTEVVTLGQHLLEDQTLIRIDRSTTAGDGAN